MPVDASCSSAALRWPYSRMAWSTSSLSVVLSCIDASYTSLHNSDFVAVNWCIFVHDNHGPNAVIGTDRYVDSGTRTVDQETVVCRRLVWRAHPIPFTSRAFIVCMAQLVINDTAKIAQLQTVIRAVSVS